MSSPKPDDSETPPPAATSAFTNPPALIAFILALVVLCFVGFSIAYFCRYYFVGIFHTWAFQRSTSDGGNLVHLSSNNANSSSAYRGLDPLVLQSFPTFLYASVKDLRKEKSYSLECAICLLEFEDDSMLRLLTVCCHVFHQECIDLWFCSHKTCPVCRKDLDSPTDEAIKSQEQGEDNVDVEEERWSDVCIDIKEGGGDEDVRGRDHQRHDNDDGDEAVCVSMNMQQQGEQKFARSHSTGHSIVMIRGEDEGKDDDKYTLRLPEHVAVLRVVGGGGGHNYSKSCTSYKDMARPVAPCINCGYVETLSGCSSRRGTDENI